MYITNLLESSYLAKSSIIELFSYILQQPRWRIEAFTLKAMPQQMIQFTIKVGV